MNPFNVKTVKLNGKNLIEASAGTGKTFSIAVLVLRFVLESNFKIKEFLLVTFTEAAVAELEERVRKFLNEAHKYVKTGVEIDVLLQEIINLSIEKQGKEAIEEKLRNALVLLDEIQITTIHGFCNNSLKQFAFETQQLFEKELITDESKLVEQSVNEFWRREITQLPLENLEVLFSVGFSRSELVQSAKKSLSGFKFTANAALSETVISEIGELEPVFEAQKAKIFNGLKADESIYKTLKGRNSESYFEAEEAFYQFIESKINSPKPPAYLNKLPEDFLSDTHTAIDLESKIQATKIAYKASVHEACLGFVHDKIAQLKKQESLQSFNDMINDVHLAIQGEHKVNFITQLKKRYKVVFIDEFQDTDKMQYDIFYEAFGNKIYDSLEGVYPTTVFYIGDPKQSIYAFRQANLATYNLAKESSKSFTMDTNFRSVPKYIAAMNLFFLPVQGFNFFKEDKINYLEVKALSDESKYKDLTIKGLEDKPLAFVEYKVVGDAFDDIAAQVYEFLTNAKIDGKAIKPSDIGVLVRKNSQGKDIKASLSKYSIPSVVVDDSKVLKSEEALLIRYLLQLFAEPNRNNLNKVLVSAFTFYSEKDLEQLDLSKELNRIGVLIEECTQYGVYPSLMSFLKLYDCQMALQHNSASNADRAISNYMQIAEVCNQRQLRYNEDLIAIIAWLKKEYEQDDALSMYEQRIESDQEAVNIVTIHKSKGLQYKIVFIFCPDSSSSKAQGLINYQNLTGEYEFTFAELNEEAFQLKEQQEAQELMRLWYVALTRAVYKSFVYWKSVASNPGIIQTHKQLLIQDNRYHDYFEELEKKELEIETYITDNQFNYKEYPKVNTAIDFKTSWSISSYSSIRNKEYHHVQKTKLEGLKDYEEFVFHQMPRGASFGDFMHQIFENIDFQNQDKIKSYLKRKVNSSTSNSILNEKNEVQYLEFINQVLESKLMGDFKIKDIVNKLPEIEFYFQIDQLSEVELSKDFEFPISFEQKEYKGFVNGFIDLTFEADGKYYILDWKSNHLGDELSAYSAENIAQAMTESNYHLQYFIYTIALCRQLKQINPAFDYDTDFGGVFYVFVRGCRKGEGSGVFQHKPSRKSIEKYL